MTLTCPKCDLHLPPPGKFCPKCGGDLLGADAGARTWIIGRDPGCDIVLTDPTVSRRHAMLTGQGGMFMLEDLGSTHGTFVNGKPLYAPSPVRPADCITLGANVTLTWPVSAAESGPRKPLRIGSASDNDIVISLPSVDPYHARVTFDSSGNSILEDLNSTSGTFLNSLGNRIRSSRISPDDTVFLGTYRVKGAQLLSSRRRLTVGVAEVRIIEMNKPILRIGRDPDQNDYVLDSPNISRKHAEVERSPTGLILRNLSGNGTYVGGRRIDGASEIQLSDIVHIGPYSLSFSQSGRLQAQDGRSALVLQADGVHTVDRRLKPVSLTFYPSELVAIMGPSGHGKTTLLEALLGYRPIGGRVLLNRVDLHRNFNLFRLLIGYVPQEDIMHTSLTVSEALYYTARLRTTLKPATIRKRAIEVLASLDLEGSANKLIGSVEKKTLSGGQRKRVNIALELMGEPPIVFLDEPTSGLSFEDAENVIRLLKSLTERGTTVVTTIHQPSLEIFRTIDALAVIARDGEGPGGLIYFGPTVPDSLRFFNEEAVAQLQAQSREPGPDLLLKRLVHPNSAERLPASHFEAKFHNSPYKAKYIDGRAQSDPPKQPQGRSARQFNFRQIVPLVQRNMLLKIRDTEQRALLLLQAPLFALLVVAVYQRLSDTATFSLADLIAWKRYVSRAAGIHFVMVVAAIWFGCNNAVREIVGEWAVYRRERMVNLKIPSYIASKFLVLGGLSALQCLVLLAIVALGCNLAAPLHTSYAMLTLASLVGVAGGLCISAWKTTTDSAIAVLPLVLLPIIILGGGLKPLQELPSAVSTASAILPARWAFEANLNEEARVRAGRVSGPAADSDVAETHFPKEFEESISSGGTIKRMRERATPAECAAVLLGMLSFLTVLSALLLYRRDIR